MMDNYLAELAKSRADLVKELLSINWSYSGRQSKVEEINKQIEQIDKMIDRVLEPNTAQFNSKGKDNG